MRKLMLLGMLVGANLLWGSSWVIAKWTLADMTPIQVSAWRMILAGIPVLPWLWWVLRREPVSPGLWPRLLILGGVAFVLSKFLNLWGLNLTTATDASLLMAVEPLLTIALGALVLKEAFTKRRLSAFAVGAFGAYLLIAGGWGWPGLSSTHALGDIIFLIGLIGEAAYSVFGKSLLQRHSALLVTLATIAASLVFWLPLAAYDGIIHGWPPINGTTVTAMAVLGLGCTVLAYWAWFHALEELEVGFAALTIFLQPVWGALLAGVFLGESMGLTTLIGGALVLLSMYLALGGPQKTESQKAAPQ